MKVIDRSAKEADKSTFNKITGRIRKIMEFGLSWESDIEAQEVIITQLGKALSNKYILLRNVQLEGLEIPIPLILVGPPGVFVMYTSALKGVYRAKGETWSVMNNRTRKFDPARPNLITRILLMTRAVEAFLARRGHRLLEIQSVLLFSNPGTHVDAIRPAVRVVLMDGLERFISSLAQTRTFLAGEDIQSIIDAILQPPASSAPGAAGGETPVQVQERDAPSLPKAAPTKLTQSYVSFTNRFALSARQWILLAAIAVLEILLLVAFIVYMLLTS